MSAFLCSEFQTAICALVASRIEAHKDAATARTPVSLFHGFRAVNNAALFHRYGDKPVRATHAVANLKKAELFIASHPLPDVRGIVSCLVYQCSEGIALESSPFGVILLNTNSHMEASYPIGAPSSFWSI